MKLSTWTLTMPAFVLALALSPPSDAGTIRYELREGSILIDDCIVCLRPSYEMALRGSFLLSPSLRGNAAEGNLFDLTELFFFTLDGGYAGTGDGLLSASDDFSSQGLRLEVEINGVSGIELENTVSDPVTAPWPTIDIWVREKAPRDPLHLYSLRLVAAPVAELVPYELAEGSMLVETCTPECRRLDILAPLTGTFLLGEIAGAPNPVSTYRVDAIDFRGAAGDREFRVTGAGTYRQGGEVALLQEMRLEVAVNDRPSVILRAAPASPGATFPAIDIELEEENPPFDHYRLRIVARPRSSPSPAYRRGDATGEGTVNLTDAVDILAWLFMHGAAPGCLDAADANDDETVDAGDPVYLLFYIFLDGPPPPSPGTERCGWAATPSLGCETYPSCGGA
jgi:hypothetical protein